MKKKFKARKRRNKMFKIKFLLFLIMFNTSLFTTFKILLQSNIKFSNKKLVEFILKSNNPKNGIDILINNIKNRYSPVNLLNTNYYELTDKKKVDNKVDKSNKENLIYIYNTHQKEEYKSTSFIENQVNPTVMMASYIMQDVFNKNNYKTIVEERSISDILDKNNWKYYRSYDASRIYLDDAKKTNKSLKYFIDVHRDSLSKNDTTIVINNKSYAKVIFLIGLENPNYQKNLEFTEKINNKINEKYPNLSKGIYKKGGKGVNGVYNQDNSEYTILIEIGGVDNNTTEVLNSTLAFTEVFMEVINEG